jgi:hypothetical protein
MCANSGDRKVSSGSLFKSFEKATPC